jgi:hypothetical protein
VLGLSVEGNRLEGCVLRRGRSGIEAPQALSAALSLDPFTHDVDLVGREIRKLLDQAQIRERHCVVCIPLSWVLTLRIQLPDLPEEDLASLLVMEAERGFPCDLELLSLSESRFSAPGGQRYALLTGVAKQQLSRLESVLEAAQLRPIWMCPGICAMEGAVRAEDAGRASFLLSSEGASLQVLGKGGIAALRYLEGIWERGESGLQVQIPQVLRELRITLGQLPPGLRESVRRIQVFGQGAAVELLWTGLRSSMEGMGVTVDLAVLADDGPVTKRLPSGLALTPWAMLAARYLNEVPPTLQYLQPKVSPFRQFLAKCSTRRTAWVAGTAGTIGMVLLLGFLVQQVQLWRWQSKWKAVSSRVYELEDMQSQIRRYRPWFDESIRSLSILKRLTEAFPEDGAVSAKTVEMRDSSQVTCHGTARDRQALLRVLEKLGGGEEVNNVKVEQIRGKTPLEFTFSFQWKDRTSS